MIINKWLAKSLVDSVTEIVTPGQGRKSTHVCEFMKAIAIFFARNRGTVKLKSARS